MSALQPFSGPETLQKAWEDFADKQGGESAHVAQRLNLLNEYLQPGATAAKILAAHPGLGFAELKAGIEGLCEAQSISSADPGPARRLNDYIITQLLNKWIPLLGEHGFYPPPEAHNLPRSEKLRRQVVTQSAEGSLISGALTTACLGTVYGACKEVRGKLSYVDKADTSHAESEAMPVLENTLFRYNDDKGANRERSSGERFKNYLYGRVVMIVSRRILGNIDYARSLDAVVGHGDERSGHEKIEDKKAEDPQTVAEHRDQIAKVEGMLADFTEREQGIIRMRYGLNAQKHAYTLEEVGRFYDVTRERIRQIEARVMRSLQRRAHMAQTPAAAPVMEQARPDGMEPWLYEQHFPRRLALKMMEAAREKVVANQGVQGDADIYVRQIELNSRAIPPMMRGMALLRNGNLAGFDRLMEKMRHGFREDAPPLAPSLARCFDEESPAVDITAMGAERAMEVGKFLHILREAHGCADMSELSRRIAAQNPGIIAENLRLALTRMRVPDEELDKPLTEEARKRHYRTILVNDPGGLNYAEAVAQFAFPGEEYQAERECCISFLSSKRYWARKAGLGRLEPQAAAVREQAAPCVTASGFVQKTFNTEDALPLDEVRPLVERAREAFAAMPVYDREKAEAIATELFNALTVPYSLSRVAALSVGEVNGRETKINSGTLSRWRSGRKEGGVIKPGKVDIDTVMQVADALAHAVIAQEGEGKALAREAAAYMCGLPWVTPRKPAGLLSYVQERGLDTAHYMLLARRQLRMPQHEFEKYLHVPHERYAEMIAPAEKKYAQVNLGDLEEFIDRQGLETLKDKARFRRMVLRKEPADFGAGQAEVEAFCREAAARGDTGVMKPLAHMLVEHHGMRKLDDLAAAVFCHEGKTETAQGHLRGLLLRCLRQAEASDGKSDMPPALARWVADFALPGADGALVKDMAALITGHNYARGVEVMERVKRSTSAVGSPS